MKIAIIGATGTVGKAVANELRPRHQIIEVGRTSGEIHVDLTDEESIHALFERIGRIDALVAAAGQVHFGPLGRMTADQFRLGLHDKLLGQVNLALIGQHHLSDGGSITLTSGILSDEPIVGGANAAAVSAAVDGFVRAAAIELPRGIRINAVSPSVVRESLDTYGPFFKGFEAVPASRVALAYSRSVEGGQTGKVYKVW